MTPARDEAPVLARLVSPLRERASEILGRLAPRERAMLFGAGVVTVLLILWLGIVEPLGESLARLDREVARAREDAAAIDGLVSRYRTLRSEVDALERGATADRGGASLFAQLESISVPIAGRERIIAMNPSTREVAGELTEETVEMRIEGITMRGLVSLLHAIESRDPPISIERVAVKRQYKDQTRVDATVAVTRLRPR